MKLNTLVVAGSMITAFFLISACGKSAAQLEAEQRTLDADTTVVSACTFNAVLPISIPMLSGEETAAVCDKMARTLGRNPSVRLLRHLSKAISSMKVQGRGDDTAANAYQFMRVVENRGQLNDEDRMLNTFDVVFKIVGGTDGRVMPKDLNIFLSNLGAGAKTMSDDGLYHSAAMLSVMKQNQGE